MGGYERLRVVMSGYEWLCVYGWLLVVTGCYGWL